MTKTDSGFKEVNREYDYANGRDLQAAFDHDNKIGIKREMIEVFEEPREFIFGILYVLRGGKRAWIYKEVKDAN